jgi:hypothetical protein
MPALRSSPGVKTARALASDRRHREAIEKELFRGRYTLASKNDDELPVP